MWEIHVSDQAETFLLAMVLGVILCLFYDCIRAVRKGAGHAAAAVFIGDILFWLVSAVITFLFLLARTNGEVRGFVLAAEGTGGVLCRLTVSRLVFPVLRTVFTFLFRTVRLLNRKISAVFVATARGLTHFRAFCVTNMKKQRKLLKKLLKKVQEMMYTKEDIKSSEKTES